MTYAYNEESCPNNDDFSLVTFDTLALQYSSVNLKLDICYSIDSSRGEPDVNALHYIMVNGLVH